MMHVLALDVGTSSVKAAILDVERAAPVGPIAHVSHPLDHPTPEAAEIQPEQLWQAVTGAARAAVQAHGRDIQGIGLSCLMPALVLLDDAGRPLGPIWTHLDRRSRPVARRVWQEVGPELLATAGNRPLPGGISAVCYRQQVEDDPQLPARVRGYLHANSWLGLRLTGRRAFDPANACFTGLFNTVTDQRWSPRWCHYFGVDPSWLPEVVPGDSTLGALQAEAAAEMGLPPGLPVKIGTADTSSAVLAAGMTDDDLLHVVGTTQVLAVLAERPQPDGRRLTRLLGVGPRFLEVTHNPVGGVALEWLHGLCFHDQDAKTFFGPTLDAALVRVSSLSDPSEGVRLEPPFLGGDRLEIEEHRAALHGLTLSTDRMDLLAAVLAEMRRQHERAVAALGKGTRFRRVFLTGGGADMVRRLIPSYADVELHELVEGSLCGVARLWQEG